VPLTRIGLTSPLAVLAALFALGTPSPTLAGDLPQGGWRTLRVGVLPVAYYGRKGEQLFGASPEVRQAHELAGRWHRRLEDRAAALDQVVVLRSNQLRERITRTRDYHRTVAVASERFDLGVLRYHEIQPVEALDHFAKARTLYTSVYADIAAPHDLADVAFYEGLILTEQQEPTRAHMVFRELLVLDPERRFERGYYPPAIEKALAGAQDDVALHLEGIIAARFSPERLEGLARQLDVDAFIVTGIAGPPSAPELRLAVYDHRTRGYATVERIALADEAAAADALDRTLTAWHACALEADATGMFRAPPRKRWYLDLGYTHGVWVKHPRTRDPLMSAGGQLTVTYEPNPALSLFVRAAQLANLTDGNGDLLDSFVEARLTVGAGLAFGSPSLRFFLRMGLDAGLSLSNLEMTTDVDCKFFGLDHERCTSSFTAEAPAIWFGLDFALGTRVAIADSWYLAATLGLASYLFDPDVAGALNFPLQASPGFGAGL